MRGVRRVVLFVREYPAVLLLAVAGAAMLAAAAYMLVLRDQTRDTTKSQLTLREIELVESQLQGVPWDGRARRGMSTLPAIAQLDRRGQALIARYARSAASSPQPDLLEKHRRLVSSIRRQATLVSSGDLAGAGIYGLRSVEPQYRDLMQRLEGLVAAGTRTADSTRRDLLLALIVILGSAFAVSGLVFARYHRMRTAALRRQLAQALAENAETSLRTMHETIVSVLDGETGDLDGAQATFLRLARHQGDEALERLERLRVELAGHDRN